MKVGETTTDKKIDYEAALKDETVQALLTHLNIAANVSQILANESVLHILTACKTNQIQLGNKIYKKRARNYTTVEYLLGQNQDYHEFMDNNPNDLKEHSKRRLNLYFDVLMHTYGITDIEILKDNFEYLQPIAEGELYKIINNYWNSWDMEQGIDSINRILQYTTVKLQQNQIDKEKLNKKMDKLLQGQQVGVTTYQDKKEETEGQIIINKDNEIIIS